MRGRKTQLHIQLSSGDQAELERWQRLGTLRVDLARRGRLILLLADGHSFADAARIVGLTLRNARKWALRFLERGIEGLYDKPGRGRKPVFSPRGCDVFGQDRLRTTGSARQVAFAMGLHGVGCAVDA